MHGNATSHAAEGYFFPRVLWYQEQDSHAIDALLPQFKSDLVARANYKKESLLEDRNLHLKMPTGIKLFKLLVTCHLFKSKD